MKHKTIPDPILTEAKVPFFLRGAPPHHPPPVPRGPPRQARLAPGPPEGHLRRGRKHNVAPYFCVQKDFAPSSSNCRPGASSQLARRWAARHIQRPPVHLGNQPTPPRREGSSGGRPTEPPASSPARDSHSRAPPGRAALRRAAGGRDPGRAEGVSAEPPLRSRAAHPPPAPGPGALSRAARSRAREERPGPGFHGAEKAAARRTQGGRGRPEPWGSQEGSRLPLEPARTPGA